MEGGGGGGSRWQDEVEPDLRPRMVEQMYVDRSRASPLPPSILSLRYPCFSFAVEVVRLQDVVGGLWFISSPNPRTHLSVALISGPRLILPTIGS